MGTLGADLQHARELAGLSLDDLSARTKIRKTLLEAIERDDYRSIPGGLHARGYLRAYAKEVGLEAEPVASRYRMEVGAEAPPLTDPSRHQAAAEDLLRPSRSLMPFAALAILAMVGVWLYVNRPQQQSDGLQPVGTAGEGAPAGRPTDRPAGRMADPIRAANASGVVSAASAPLMLEIAPTEVVWIEATADGRRVLYALVVPEQRRAIQAREQIVLRIGDAGAFRYRLNGVDGREIGRSGEVREVRITPQNVRTFQSR
jgi:transcriptional regulator with XRE-family HTH domain